MSMLSFKKLTSRQASDPTFPTSLAEEVKKPVHVKPASVASHISVLASGLPELDTLLLPGGIPLSSSLLLEEDKYKVFTSCIVRLFGSQGLLHDQHVFYLAAPQTPFESKEKVLKRWPGTLSEMTLKQPSLQSEEQKRNITSADHLKPTSDAQDRMKIAWRYERSIPSSFNMLANPSSSSASSSFSTSFDLSTSLQQQNPSYFTKLTYASLCPASSEDTKMSSSTLTDLLVSIDHFLGKVSKADKQATSPCRVIIESFGGSLWNRWQEDELILWLDRLVRKMKKTKAVLLLTYSLSYLQCKGYRTLLDALYHMGDCILCVHEDKGVGDNGSKGKYRQEGSMKFVKPMYWSHVAPWIPCHTLWRVVMNKRKLSVEVYSLPPEGLEDDRPSRSSSKSLFAGPQQQVGCGTSLTSSSSPIDF